MPVHGADAANVAALRQAITASEEIPGLADFAESAELLPLATLTQSAHTAWRAYVDGRHTELLHALPTLLMDTLRLAHDAENDIQAAAHRVLSTTYRLGAGLAGRFGLDDLAWTSAERALQAARVSDSPDLDHDYDNRTSATADEQTNYGSKLGSHRSITRHSRIWLACTRGRAGIGRCRDRPRPASRRWRGQPGSAEQRQRSHPQTPPHHPACCG
jgi:hypothetical protein